MTSSCHNTHIKQLQLLYKRALISVPTKEKCSNKTISKQARSKWKISSQKLHLTCSSRTKKCPEYSCRKNSQVGFTLSQAMKALRESRGTALPYFFRPWHQKGVTPRPLLTPGKDPVPIVQEAWWAPGPVWTGVENLAPTGIQSPDRPARSSVAIPTKLPGPQKNS